MIDTVTPYQTTAYSTVIIIVVDLVIVIEARTMCVIVVAKGGII